MPRNSERKVAAHVQAAIAAGQGVGQAKMGGRENGREMAAHVGAAIAAGQGVGQAKMGERRVGGRRLMCRRRLHLRPQATRATRRKRRDLNHQCGRYS